MNYIRIKNPNLNYFKYGGCRAIVRVQEAKTKSLGKIGKKCIFLKYAFQSKAY